MKKKIHRTKRTSKKKKKISTAEIILSALLIIAAIVLLVRYFNPPTTYYLKRITSQGQDELGTYHSLKEAKQDMTNKADAKKQINMAIYDENERMIAIAYGIVDFRGSDCGVNVAYERESDGENGYTNGCYGADGLYLDTSDDGQRVRFQQSGVIGWVDLDQVTLRNYFQEDEVSSIQYYEVRNRRLYHKITTDVSKATYANRLDQGTIDLADGAYFSYDGHYFYSSFSQMSDDVRKNTHEHSVNQNPHYDVYQYGSHRSTTSYTSDEINWYIENYLGFKTQSSSLLYQSATAFLDAQNRYGTNAIMMLSLAMNESDFGRSTIAVQKNNLFGHAAYDASPGESSTAYKNVKESIIVHARDYLHQGYLYPSDSRYHGAFFGDKSSGMNVSYASDPYWGEKAASYYRTFDEVMGGKDQKKFKILISEKEPKIYALAKDETILYESKKGQLASFLILGESKDSQGRTWYKVRSDYPVRDHKLIKDSETYSLADSYGYILKSDA